MGERTYALYKNKIYQWIDLLEKFNIEHQEYASAHVEWDREVSRNKKLASLNIKVVDKDGNEFSNNNDSSGDLTENRITKRHREFIWKRDVGNSKSGLCYVCHEPISDDNFETGHVISKFNGGDNHVSNLRAICIPCNRAMGTMNLEEFKKDFKKNRVVILNDNRLDDITKENVVDFFRNHISDINYGKYFAKAIELLEE